MCLSHLSQRLSQFVSMEAIIPEKQSILPVFVFVSVVSVVPTEGFMQENSQNGRFCVCLTCLTCLTCLRGVSLALIKKNNLSLHCRKQVKNGWFRFLSHLSHLLKNSQIGRLCVCLTCLTCLNPPPCVRSGSPHPRLDAVCQKHAKSGPSWANQYQTRVGRASIERRLGGPVSSPSGLGEPSPSRWVSKLNKQARLSLLAFFGVE